MRTRRGYTLVECLVVLTLTGTALGTSALTMHALSRAERQVREEFQDAGDLARLAVQLREDAHQALSARIESSGEPPTSANVLSLPAPDDRIVQYTLQDANLERVVRQAGIVQHRETYGLPTATAAHWQVVSDRPRLLVSLVWAPEPGRAGGPPGSAMGRLDAAVQVLRNPDAALSPRPK